MKKLLLILLCLPMIGFGQTDFTECYITDTVVLVDKMDYMEGYDLTFKSLTTIKKESYYINYSDNIKTESNLQDFLIFFDHIGWEGSSISWDDMRTEQRYVIRYYLGKYKRDLPTDITWGYEVVIGNYIFEIRTLK